LKPLFTKQAKSFVGNELPTKPEAISECYTKLDVSNWWQGDIYPSNAFAHNTLLAAEVPYWMLLNRTCQLYFGEGRSPKLPCLNYAAVYPLHQAIKFSGDAKIKNIISALVNGKAEGFVFLPANQYYIINTPLVVNFNLIHTLPIKSCPEARDKCIQLASPFCEHIFQKFSRYFYTVGYDDKRFKSDSYISELINMVENTTN